MTQPPYLSIDQCVERIDEPNKEPAKQLLFHHRAKFLNAPGSGHNHQAWRGGYMNHIEEGLNSAVVLYATLHACRPLPFSESDALLTFYLHDAEKSFKREFLEDGSVREDARFKDAVFQEAFVKNLIEQYGFELTDEHKNALRYTHGEVGEYSGTERKMGRLAAFVHSADVLSARLWHDHPLEKNDPWRGSRRYTPNQPL